MSIGMKLDALQELAELNRQLAEENDPARVRYVYQTEALADDSDYFGR